MSNPYNERHGSKFANCQKCISSWGFIIVQLIIQIDAILSFKLNVENAVIELDYKSESYIKALTSLKPDQQNCATIGWSNSVAPVQQHQIAARVPTFHNTT